MYRNPLFWIVLLVGLALLPFPSTAQTPVSTIPSATLSPMNYIVPPNDNSDLVPSGAVIDYAVDCGGSGGIPYGSTGAIWQADGNYMEGQAAPDISAIDPGYLTADQVDPNNLYPAISIGKTVRYNHGPITYEFGGLDGNPGDNEYHVWIFSYGNALRITNISVNDTTVANNIETSYATFPYYAFTGQVYPDSNGALTITISGGPGYNPDVSPTVQVSSIVVWHKVFTNVVQITGTVYQGSMSVMYADTWPVSPDAAVGAPPTSAITGTDPNAAAVTYVWPGGVGAYQATLTGGPSLGYSTNTLNFLAFGTPTGGDWNAVGNQWEPPYSSGAGHAIGWFSAGPCDTIGVWAFKWGHLSFHLTVAANPANSNTTFICGTGSGGSGSGGSGSGSGGGGGTVSDTCYQVCHLGGDVLVGLTDTITGALVALFEPRTDLLELLKYEEKRFQGLPPQILAQDLMNLDTEFPANTDADGNPVPASFSFSLPMPALAYIVTPPPDGSGGSSGPGLTSKSARYRSVASTGEHYLRHVSMLGDPGSGSSQPVGPRDTAGNPLFPNSYPMSEQTLDFNFDYTWMAHLSAWSWVRAFMGLCVQMGPILYIIRMFTPTPTY